MSKIIIFRDFNIISCDSSMQRNSELNFLMKYVEHYEFFIVEFLGSLFSPKVSR